MNFASIHNIALLLLALSLGYRLSQVKKRMRAHETVTLANAKALLALSEALGKTPLPSITSEQPDDYH